MKFSTFTTVIYELKNFSAEELLQIREEVDRLIQSKKVSGDIHSNITIPLSEAANDDMQALNSMIRLIENWLQDESGYDEEVYPNIKTVLTKE